MKTFTKEQFKDLWYDDALVVTYDDIANCAVAWGVSSSPRTSGINTIRYLVLKAANIEEAEEYNPKGLLS